LLVLLLLVLAESILEPTSKSKISDLPLAFTDGFTDTDYYFLTVFF
jgi:hypothetical protein